MAREGDICATSPTILETLFLPIFQWSIPKLCHQIVHAMQLCYTHVCTWYRGLHWLVAEHCCKHFWSSVRGWSFPRFRILESDASGTEREGLEVTLHCRQQVSRWCAPDMSSSAGTNFVSSPGRVGRKKGAGLGCLGGSTGLFRFWVICMRDKLYQFSF